jgi:cyclopropane fatty-acyl-phospholipid synthase-like methyltransferase
VFELSFKEIVSLAIKPYERSGKFAWHFAKGKLSGDPAFAGMLRLGLIPQNARLLDIGCGQGLLAACLWAASEIADKGGWPLGWAAAPRGCRVHGIELMQKDVDRANAALNHSVPSATFECANMVEAKFSPCDVVVILDVLHYVNFDQQKQVLQRIFAALDAKGKLLVRVGDADGGLPFKISNWVDNIVMFIRGHRLSRLYCMSVAQWTSVLAGVGFTVKPMPMNSGTPFANILLICEKSTTSAAQPV